MICFITEQTCAAPVITNGVVEPTIEVEYNGVFTVSCNTGFILAGETYVTCRGTDSFDNLPTCTSKYLHLKKSNQVHHYEYDLSSKIKINIFNRRQSISPQLPPAADQK